MPELGELGNQRLIVIDLAVEDDDNAPVLVPQRLLPGRQIDDRKPPVRKTDAGLDVKTALVGSAVVLRFVHPRQQRAVDVARSSRIENACESTHRLRLRLDSV